MPPPIFAPAHGKDRFGRNIDKCKRDNSNPSRYEVLAYTRPIPNGELVARVLDTKVCEEHRTSNVPELRGDEIVGYDILY